MPRLRSLAILVSVLLPALLLPASSQPAASPKVALHVQVPAAKGACGDAAPTFPCAQFTTFGRDLHTPYNVYLVAAQGPLSGIAGISCGITYDPNELFVDWTLCADLEFTNAGDLGEWPNAGGGNRITWVSTTNCQNTDVGDGAQAIAGFFYVYAYTSGVLAVTPNENLSNPEFTYSDCSANQVDLPVTAAGSAAFGPQGGSGCNPCFSPCDGAVGCLVSASILDFGTVPVGVATTRSVVFSNETSTSINGAFRVDCPGFTIVSGGGPYVLSPGESHTVEVQWIPLGLGPVSCSLTTDSGCSHVFLIGEGFETCLTAPAIVDFGAVPTFDTAVQTIEITNNNDISLSGTAQLDCDDFTILTGGGPFTLEPGESLILEVQWIPTSTGRTSCPLELVPGCSGVFLKGVAGGLCVTTPSSLDFGLVTLETSMSEIIEFTNESQTLTISGNAQLLEPCPDFSITAGDGPFTLGPGETREVEITFSPTVIGPLSCTLSGGADCQDVVLEGRGAGDGAVCVVAPAALDFGELRVGERRTQTFWIRNEGDEPVTGSVISSCPDFSIVNGSRVYIINPGMSGRVWVEFAPNTSGDFTCQLSNLGSDCVNVTVTGKAVFDGDPCMVNPPSGSFGSAIVGREILRNFEIRNNSPDPVWGEITMGEGEACSDFSIRLGGGSYYLDPGESHAFNVQFKPTTTGTRECSVSISGTCNNLPLVGQGTVQEIPPTQSAAVISLHGQVPSKAEGCMSIYDLACSDYNVHLPGTPASGYDIYLVVCRGHAGYGIGGLSCGVTYDEPSTLFSSWTLCADLDFPNDGGNGEWPADLGGNRITWEVQTNCQQTEVADEGVHAIAGFFYIYTYDGNNGLTITPNNNVEGGPEVEVADCSAVVTSFPPEDVGRISIGNLAGYNPCSRTPVELFAFTAARTGSDVLVEWSTGDDLSTLEGFHLYRESGGNRIRLTEFPLSGEREYAFRDADPPQDATDYHLAELSRSGDVIWHGPVTVPASAPTPSVLTLLPAQPNPFRSTTEIAFRLPVETTARIRVFDTVGREVAQPYRGVLSSGDHRVPWNGRNANGNQLQAGVYLYRVETSVGHLTGRLVFMP